MSTTDIFLRSRWQRIQPTREFARENRRKKIGKVRYISTSAMYARLTPEERQECDNELLSHVWLVVDNDSQTNPFTEYYLNRDNIIKKHYRNHLMKKRGCQIDDELERCFADG